MPDAPLRPSLAGSRLLLVEDDYLVAAILSQEFEDAGAEVVGPAPTVAAALDLLAAGSIVDAAVLDVSLGGEKVWPVADALQARGVPFVFATGYDAAVILPRYAGVPRCEKPVDVIGVVRALFD